MLIWPSSTIQKYLNHHPLSTVGHKSTKSLYLKISLKNQVISSIIDPETLYHFSEWQNTPPIFVRGPIVNPPFHVELRINQIFHAQYLRNHLETNGSMFITIRKHL